MAEENLFIFINYSTGSFKPEVWKKENSVIQQHAVREENQQCQRLYQLYAGWVRTQESSSKFPDL